MRICLPLLLTAVWLTWPSGCTAADAPPSDSPATRRPKAVSCVSLVKRRDGDQALVISYPWKIHRRPSVEVRLVTGKDPGAAVVRPLFFVKQYMRGEVAATLYRCEDKATSTGVRESVKAEGDDFEVTTEPENLEQVNRALQQAGFEPSNVEVTYLPTATVSVEGNDARGLLRLMQQLEDQTDVQQVYANFDVPDEVMAQEAV